MTQAIGSRKLTKREDLVAERGHQGRVFPNLAAAVDLGKAQPLLRRRRRFSHRQIAAQLAAQQDDPALPVSLPCQSCPASLQFASRIARSNRAANVFGQPEAE
jgi:hypothetical protein